MKKLSIKRRTPIGIAMVTLLLSGPAAMAKADLVFVHNASPYHVWSDLVKCQYDMRNAGNGCDNFGYKSFCGKHMFSTSATSRIAKDRWGRGQNVLLYANNGSNEKVCNITP